MAGVRSGQIERGGPRLKSQAGQAYNAELSRMQYDLFLSYSRDDVGWAIELQSRLDQAGLRVFRDEDRLRAGDEWEKGLVKALGESQHLVALWSAAARGSDWVTRELGHFDALSTQDPRRRIISVNLDETQNRAYNSLQSITSLGGAKASAVPPERVDANVWADVIRRISETVQDQEDGIPISVAVLTVTEEEADPARPGGLSQAELERINSSFTLDVAAVKARYQRLRLDWHPYGEPLTIRTLLDNLITELNRVVKKRLPLNKQFRWRAVPDEFWDDMSTGKPDEVVAQMDSKPLSLVVVDTLMLHYLPVFQRASKLRAGLTSRSCAWLFVPPKASDKQLLVYRDVLRAWSSPLLDEYFEPPVPTNTATPLFGYCGDDREIKRLLRTAAGEYLAQQTAAPGNVFTRMRSDG